jgi:hypothetical protein
MLKHMAMILVFVLSPLLAQAKGAICLQGKMSVPLDDRGPEFAREAKLDFKIELPAGEGVGRFTTVLTNADEPYTGKTRRGTDMTKVADAITPDDLPLRRSNLGFRCPCEQVLTQERDVVIDIEQIFGGVQVRFTRYFNVNGLDAIQVSDVTPCQ